MKMIVLDRQRLIQPEAVPDFTELRFVRPGGGDHERRIGSDPGGPENQHGYDPYNDNPQQKTSNDISFHRLPTTANRISAGVWGEGPAPRSKPLS